MTAARRLDLIAVVALALGLVLVVGSPAIWRAIDPWPAAWACVVSTELGETALDPWGRPFRHLPGAAGEPIVSDPRGRTTGVEGAYSIGSDGIDEQGKGDDVVLLSTSPRIGELVGIYFLWIRLFCGVGLMLTLVGYLLARAPRAPWRVLDLTLGIAAALAWFLATLWLLGVMCLVTGRSGRSLFEDAAYRVVPPLVAAAITVAGASFGAVWLVRRLSRADASGQGQGRGIGMGPLGAAASHGSTGGAPGGG